MFVWREGKHVTLLAASLLAWRVANPLFFLPPSLPPSLPLTPTPTRLPRCNMPFALIASPWPRRETDRPTRTVSRPTSRDIQFIHIPYSYFAGSG